MLTRGDGTRLSSRTTDSACHPEDQRSDDRDRESRKGDAGESSENARREREHGSPGRAEQSSSADQPPLAEASGQDLGQGSPDDHRTRKHAGAKSSDNCAAT